MLSFGYLGPMVGLAPSSGWAPAEQTAPRTEASFDFGRVAAVPQGATFAATESDAPDRDFPGVYIVMQQVAAAPLGRAGPTSDDVEAALSQARAASLAAQRAYRHAALLESQSFSPAAATMMALFGRAAAIDSMAGSRANPAIPCTGARVIPAGQLTEGRLSRRD